MKTLKFLLLAALCLFLLASCGTDWLVDSLMPTPEPGTVGTDADSACAHEFGEWVTVKRPTCTEEGAAERACALCGKVETGTYRAKGHTEEPIPDLDATCTTGGSTGGTRCTVCMEVLLPPESVTLPKGHSFSESGLCADCGIPRDSAEGLAYLDLYSSTYGYESLAALPNGERMQALYRRIDAAARRFHTDPTAATGDSHLFFTIVLKEDGVTADEARAVWKVFRDDNPLYYWISSSVSYNDSVINLLVTEDYAEGADRIACNARLYAAMGRMLAKVPQDASDYKTAWILHDALIESIDYAYDQNGLPQSAHWAHSIVGVFEERGAVCEGFAKAFQLLMNISGVDSIYVTGMSRGEAHAWNLLCVEGKWYGVDVTWDDNNEKSSPYRYFCLSADAMAEDHTPDTPDAVGMDYLYPLPALSAYGLEYVTVYCDGFPFGVYSCLDEAFAAINGTSCNYSVELNGGDAYHEAAAFHITGDWPSLTRNLTLIGRHVVGEGGTYTATRVLITHDSELTCDVYLKKLFFGSTKPVVLNTKGHEFYHRNDTVFYSAVMDSVTVIGK